MYYLKPDSPKCDTEHYYDPSTDTCVTECDNLGEDFTVYKDLSLWDNNHEILTNIKTLPDCITRCLAATYITLSIDFSADEEKCICATKSPGMAGMRTFTPVESYVLAVRQCAGKYICQAYPMCTQHKNTNTLSMYFVGYKLYLILQKLYLGRKVLETYFGK